MYLLFFSPFLDLIPSPCPFTCNSKLKKNPPRCPRYCIGIASANRCNAYFLRSMYWPNRCNALLSHRPANAMHDCADAMYRQADAMHCIGRYTHCIALVAALVAVAKANRFAAASASSLALCRAVRRIFSGSVMGRRGPELLFLVVMSPNGVSSLGSEGQTKVLGSRTERRVK